MTLKLEVENRTASTSAVRADGKIPAVVYGPKQEPIAISVDKFQFEKTLQEGGESTIINLVGLDEAIEVLVQDVAFDAAKGGAEHVDFYAIERGKELTTNVAFEFVGEAPVEKIGATVTKVMQDVEVTCRPSALPSHIEVDLSVLATEDAQIHISDLTIPVDVTLSVAPDAVVVAVAAARDVDSEEAVEAVDMDAVVVAGEKKEEETEEVKV